MASTHIYDSGRAQGLMQDVTCTLHEGPLLQAGVLGYLQVPQDAAVTLETAPVLEIPMVKVMSPTAHMLPLYMQSSTES